MQKNKISKYEAGFKFLKEVGTNLKQLASETDAVKQSEFFKQNLETMSKFWQYSYHNQLRILELFAIWKISSRKI